MCMKRWGTLFRPLTCTGRIFVWGFVTYKTCGNWGLCILSAQHLAKWNNAREVITSSVTFFHTENRQSQKSTWKHIITSFKISFEQDELGEPNGKIVSYVLFTMSTDHSSLVAITNPFLGTFCRVVVTWAFWNTAKRVTLKATTNALAQNCDQ